MDSQGDLSMEKIVVAFTLPIKCLGKDGEIGLMVLDWKGEFKLPWREAGPPHHHDDKADSDQ